MAHGGQIVCSVVNVLVAFVTSFQVELLPQFSRLDGIVFLTGDEMIHDEILNSKTASGVFVGDALGFSDTMLSLAETEFPCMACLRTPQVNDLLLMGKERAEAVRLIAVDEALLSKLTDVLPQLRAMFPLASIVLAYRHRDVARTLLAEISVNPSWGKVGFLPMNLNVDAWLSVLRLITSGECYVPSEIMIPKAAPTVITEQSAPALAEYEKVELPDDVKLTARELQVLKSAASGMQNKNIADELDLSQHTVKLHMHHIIAKLGVHNRTEAANWYHGHKLTS
ncbi:helix-turn-helix transcriptional regulator [Octadecabacter ascidiaceicola]|uniref:Transcriptional regulatory protein DegU n=1 Tax=Octadecabacter ascidiaceicola TaxID=1655543 RepID=A0A238JTL9_9RHOB|nr:response regulator transcription factor [Octadecabacter ascidiaceicola]SMX33925.1 Transcriptional regulatory protein DegU [Octadecabacter ascidiaceicola]